MRLLLTLFLVACSASDDTFVPGEIPDATTTTGFPDVFLPPVADVGPTEPIFVGGPVACGACTCDGTLYACLRAATADGGCPHGGGPPIPPAPITGDAGEGADADASTSCGSGRFCTQLPVECLPKPTCACITNATGLECTIDPNGNGFMLQCPPPPP